MRSEIKLYNMDCMTALREMEDNQFDLAIVDPPYGIGENGDRNASRCNLATAKNYKAFSGGDISAPDPDYFDELARVSKNQIIWGCNHFIDNLPFKGSSPCWIVWDKDNGKSDFADAELAWTSFKTAVRKFKFKWQGMLQGDMTNKEHRIHPTQKPVALYKWLLKNYAKEGQTILDTHLGSGSIALACWDLGFNLTGYELDQDYFAGAFQRLEAHKKQGQFEFAG